MAGCGGDEVRKDFLDRMNRMNGIGFYRSMEKRFLDRINKMSRMGFDENNVAG